MNQTPTQMVYASGRNPDSGTRITTLAESGFGISRYVYQWKPTSSGVNGTISALDYYPTETINGVSTVQDGNSGENSGGTLANYLTTNLAAGANQVGESGTSYLLTYMGYGDFNGVKTGASGITKPAVEVGWNGAFYSQDGIKTGAYTFWGYEHIMWRSTIGNGTPASNTAVKLTFANNLKNAIIATPSTGGTINLAPNVSLGDMRVQRSGDGGTITNPNL